MTNQPQDVCEVIIATQTMHPKPTMWTIRFERDESPGITDFLSFIKVPLGPQIGDAAKEEEWILV